MLRKTRRGFKNLVTSQTATREELDQKLAAIESARERFKVAEQSVQQARALLALASDYQHPELIPADLDAPTRRSAAQWRQGSRSWRTWVSAPAFVPWNRRDCTRPGPARRDTSDSWVDAVPAVKSARTQVDQAIAMLGGLAFDPARPYEHPGVVRARQRPRLRPS